MKYNSLSELFTAIADAIRGKTGSAELIVANDFTAAIEGIPGSGSVGDLPFEQVEIPESTENVVI